MIIKLKETITNKEFSEFKKYFSDKELKVKDISSDEIKLYGIIGDTSKLDEEQVKSIEGVDTVTRITAPYKLASRQFHPEDTIIKVGNFTIGQGNFSVIAGPCSVENIDQIISVAKDVKMSGANMLR